MAATVRLGVQLRQSPASTGPAETHEAVDDDHAAGEADEDRCQGNPSCPNVVFQTAEVAVSRKLLAAILERIRRLRTVGSLAPS
jgi:hypothetical protein